MTRAAEEKRGINCSRGDDKQPIARRCTKTSRSKSCNPVQYDGAPLRNAGVWRRERKAVYIRVVPCARSRSNNEATGCRVPPSPHPSYQTSMTDCATLMARVTLPFSPSPTGHFTAASASGCRLRLLFFRNK